jgi:hypothetical protein
MKLRDMVSKVIGGLMVFIILIFALKGCVVTVWLSSKNPIIYSVEGADGRTLRMIFLPKNETIIWYHDHNNNYVEGVLTKMKGVYGTHYFWRLWKVEGSYFTLGFRIYPADAEPVNMEITTLERYMKARGDPTFPQKGNTSNQILLFAKDSVRFQDMWLQKEADNPELVESLLNKLGGSKEIGR